MDAAFVDVFITKLPQAIGSVAYVIKAIADQPNSPAKTWPSYCGFSGLLSGGWGRAYTVVLYAAVS